MLRVNIITLQTVAMKHHVVLRCLYRFLPEESHKRGCHAGIIRVTLCLTHDNNLAVDWGIPIFRVADNIKGAAAPD